MLMRILRAVPSFDYFRFHKLCFALSIALTVISVGSLLTRGLNYGVDFAGGILIEVRTPQPTDLAQMRATLNALDLGDTNLQQFGTPNDVLIRVQQQRSSTEQQEMAAVAKIRAALGNEVEYRRVEVVGPTVGDELVRDGIYAVVLSLLGILIYMAFRFGIHAASTGVIAILHDCVTAVGLYSVTGVQFDLTSVAAIVAIAGFSINDTVVIDDRIRENLRKFKSMDFRDLINKSVNETFARTLMTNGLLLLAVIALLAFGGPVLFGFSLAMCWGVVIGTYSTIYVAAPLEWYFSKRHRKEKQAEDAAAEATTAAKKS
ncbi:MAG TPA: protein translocase subunit SecF [Alphaproteobacteria bacterium]|nr:protein translocase subunit SecF [Alphaproteobacteria bacterium]